MQSHPCLNPQNMLSTIWNDLIHSARSLAKARAFTFVCVVSLGIGMAPVIAFPFLSGAHTIAPPAWSYPDYADLRAANTGTAIVGWTYGQSEVQKDSVRAMFVSTNYFQTIGVKLFRGPGFSATPRPPGIL